MGAVSDTRSSSDHESPRGSGNAPGGDAESSGGEARVAAFVGLALLEVIRARDLPSEILDAEDPAQTMPRRLGLTEAVELQIRQLRKDVKRRRKITDEQARDLFRLVLRRPDAEEVFFQAGELLAGKDVALRGLKRIYPRGILFALARRQFRRRIHTLFGRSVGGFGKGPFVLEARGHFVLDMDPGGDACALITGLSQTLLRRYLQGSLRVVHRSCQGRKDDLCQWTVASSPG